MSLRIRALKLTAETERGQFQRELSFADGLNILHADNSAGKSTCLQAIVYALGLEGMFGPSHDVPLPHAMTDFLDAPDDVRLAVIESHVTLEIENGGGERLTMWRQVKGSVSTHLIKTIAGPALTQPGGQWPSRDYFVREAGATSSESGFHAALFRFLGLTLPSVQRFDGRSGMLYLEAVAPLFFVEQKSGFTAIEGRFPTHLRIREVAARAVEYLLNLDALQSAARSQELRETERVLRTRWTAALGKLEGVATSVSAVVVNIPAAPTASWPSSPAPAMVLSHGESWQSVDAAIVALAARVASAGFESAPAVSEQVGALQSELRDSELRLARRERTIRGLIAEYEEERADLDRIVEQAETVEREVGRTRDTLRLRALGSVQALESASGACPTCHQRIGATASFGASTASPEMTLDENLVFERERVKLLRSMQAQADHALDARRVQVAASSELIDELRARIRALKEALTADERVPSPALVEERVVAAVELRRLQLASRKFAEATNVFAGLADEWRICQTLAAALNETEVAAEDERKLRLFERLIQEQLRLYHLSSVVPESITLSRDTYRATCGGLELQFDLSGSDLTRAVWAHRLGLLEVARAESTNHPGLLILDEARQQAAAAEDFAAFLVRAAESRNAGQQVIVATSENLVALGVSLANIDCGYVHIDGRMLVQ